MAWTVLIMMTQFGKVIKKYDESKMTTQKSQQEKTPEFENDKHVCLAF